MKANTIFPIIGLCFCLTACGGDDDGANPNPDPDPNPDGKVHYTDIAPIISSNCTGCHGNTPSNGAPMSLTSLNAVKDAILNRNLIGRISLESGNPNLMPKGGPKLSQTTIDKITKWQTDGFLE